MRLCKYLMLIAAAAMTFSGCNKDEATPSSDNLVKIHVKAVSSDSRSTFIEPDGNTYPTRWSGNEKVKFSLNYAYNGAKAFNAVTEDGGVTADFDIQLTDDESGEYTLVAVSPTSASISFSNEHKSATIDVPAIQTPLATSCDEAAQILAAESATTTTLPTEVSMSFKHMTAYGCFSLANFSASGTVASIILTSEVNLAGRYYYYPATRTQSDNAPVKSISLETSARENIWFACVPADWSNTALTVKVTMDNGAVYTATKNFPADRVMKAGQIAKFVVDMSGAEYSAPVPYELVTNPYNLAIGDTFIIAAKNSNVALGAYQDTKFRNEAAILKDGTSILSPSSEVEIFEVENAATDNFLYKATVTEGYLYNDAEENQVKTTATATYWTLDIVDGAAILKLKENTPSRNWLRHNSTNTRFACYGSGQNHIAIYAKSGGATPTAVFFANAENTDLTSTTTSALFTVRGNVAWTATIEGNATFDNGTKTLNGNGIQEVKINFEANSDQANTKQYAVTVATTAAVATKSYTITFTQGLATAAGVAEVGSTLWAETWDGYSKYDVPSENGTGTTVFGGANVAYTCTGNTAIYTDALAGGTAPEILISKENKSLTVANIPTGSAKVVRLSFNSNKTAFTVTSTNNVTWEKEGNAKVWKGTISNAPSTIDLTLTNTSGSANARVDNLSLVVVSM